MSKSNRSVRVKTDFSGDRYLSVNLDQDISNLEILSLNISTDNFYKTHNSKYGCVVGRVLANDAVGVPNAKVSVFISADSDWLSDSIFSGLYPYTDISGKNDDNIRYNLLPSEQVSDCHTPVGTFPSKRMVLDDENYVEVYDKFYKYTTVTNKSGDYMLFGVPTGDTTIHTDIDLSDIGFLSQRPRDMIYKGYDINQFENANKFKSSTNLDDLAQIIQENDSVNVSSFWGEGEDDNVKITRNDVYVHYEFTPTCVFIGSIVTDNSNEGISRKCIPSGRMGKMDKLVTGAGTIEMIRKKSDGSVEEFQVQGTQLIDGNGTWCYQIPMNLDYVKTDEYGNIVPCEDPTKGIPTRTRVRFRVSLNDFESDYGANHLAKVLVPNNPMKYGDLDYNFGSNSKDSVDGGYSFRDMFWNNVYTVKSYIPRIQKGNFNNNKRFSGFKAVNINGGNNSIPYNNMRIKITFMFTLQCAIIKAMIWLMKIFNKRFAPMIYKLASAKKWLSLGFAKADKSGIKCYYVGDSICPDMEGWYFAPSCKKSEIFNNTWNTLKDDDTTADPNSIDQENGGYPERMCLTKSVDYLIQCIEINLAQEYEVINFDFYNDWINGMLYIPHWYARIKRKRHKDKFQACSETHYWGRRLTQQCALTYSGDTEGFYTDVTTVFGCKSGSKEKCHKKDGRKHVYVFNKGVNNGGLVHIEETLRGDKAYYFKPCEWHESYDGTYENRVILFATDIVLLGSLNDCDTNGIPQAFKYLSSTSYVMPSNLAKTNMDNEGFMYGYKDGTSVCSGKAGDDGANVISSQTFDNYVKWSKTLETYEKAPDDVTEYAVTEASGIDWGYTGPAQGENDELYKPGGHFLGISCLNSQTNIKSCVNLARICEIGTDMSSRDYIVMKKGDDYKYAYTLPTGLISRDDLLDGSFRGMFATLNSNRLITKIDTDTNNRIYDFISYEPRNFNGELKNRILEHDSSRTTNATRYNSTVSRLDDEGGTVDTETQLISRTFEYRSNDYYRFRFGLGNKKFVDDNGVPNKEMTKHYLIYDATNTNTVSMPVYENSYYFYFGLKDGNTSLDRLFNNFYASCETYDEDASYFMIDSKEAPFCNKDNGSVHIDFNNIESPFGVSIKRKDNSATYYFYEDVDENGDTIARISKEVHYKVLYYEDGSDDVLVTYLNKDKLDEFTKTIIETSTTETYYTNDNTLDIYGFYGTNDGIEYTISLSSSDGQSMDIEVQIGLESSNLDDITVTAKDFSGKMEDDVPEIMWMYCKEYMSSENPEKDNGYIRLDGISDIYSSAEGKGIIGFAYVTNNYYTYCVTDSNLMANSNGHKNDLSGVETEMFGSRTKLSWGNSSIGTSQTVYLWEGNTNYTVYALYYCGENSSSKYTNLIEIGKYYIRYDMPLDIYVGDTDLLYNSTIKKLISTGVYDNTNWYNAFLSDYSDITSAVYIYSYTNDDGNTVLSGETSFKGIENGTKTYVTRITPKQVWNVKKALYFENSVYTLYSEYEQSNNVLVGKTGGTSNGVLVVFGSKEKITETQTRKYPNDSENTETVTCENKMITISKECYCSNSGVATRYGGIYINEDSKKKDYSLSLSDVLVPTFGLNLAFGDVAKRLNCTMYNEDTESYDSRTFSNPNRGYGQFSSSFNNFNKVSIEGNTSFSAGDTGSTYYYGSEDGSTHYGLRAGKLNYGVMVFDTTPYITVEGNRYYPYQKDILTVPNIYMPFFFNTLFVIDTGNTVTLRSIINNGVTRAETRGSKTVYKFSAITASVGNVSREYSDTKYRTTGDLGNIMVSKEQEKIEEPSERLDISSSLYENLPYQYSLTDYDTDGIKYTGTTLDEKTFNEKLKEHTIYKYQNCNSYTDIVDSGWKVNEGDIDFSFSVTEGYPNGLDEDDLSIKPTTIEKNVTISFASISGDSGNIRYQLVSAYTNPDSHVESITFLNNVIRSYNCYGKIHNNPNSLIDDVETTEYHVPDGYYTTDNGYHSNFGSAQYMTNVYSGVYSTPFSTIKPKLLSDIIDSGNESFASDNSWTFSKLDLAGNTGYTGDVYNYVVGIYDNFTVDDNEFESDNNTECINMWNKYPKDGNLFSVVKVYKWDDFQKIIQNIVENGYSG